MKTNRSILVVMLCLIFVCSIAIIPISANETETQSGLADNVIEKETVVTDPVTTTDPVYDSATGIEDIGSQLPVTTADDILNWATTKGNEIIYMLQIFCQPFAILIFIIAAFITLIGCIGKGDMVGKGIWGMVMSVVVYAVVLYAPVILQTFVGWVAS